MAYAPGTGAHAVRRSRPRCRQNVALLAGRKGRVVAGRHAQSQETKRTDDGQPVHSFRTLLSDLATLTPKHREVRQGTQFALLARPTEIQQRALDLLGVKLQL